MTYIDFLNCFNRWVDEAKPADKVLILYFGMLALFNSRRWPEWTRIDTGDLERLARTTDRKIAYRARDCLVDAGFITYKPGKKGTVSEYKLLDFCGKSTTESPTEISKSGNFCGESNTGNHTGNPHPYRKEEEKKKETIYKHDSGQNGGRKAHSQRETYDAEFERFWEAYPRKVGKVEAHKNYQARRKDGFSDDELITAARNYAWQCKKQRTDIQYIKHARTFLGETTPFTDYLATNQDPYAESEVIQVGNPFAEYG